MKVIYFIICFISFFNLQSQTKTRVFTVYYENREHSLSKDALQTIDSVKALIDTHQVELKILAFTNAPGSYESNLRLSERRANSVAHNLKDYNLKSVLGMGELESDDPKNRCTEIYVSLPEIAFEKEISLETKEDTVSTLQIKTSDTTKLKKSTQQLSYKPKIDIEEIKSGKNIELKGLHFKPGSDIIRNNESFNVLLDLRDIMQNSDIKIKIEGHVCCSPFKDPTRDVENIRTGKMTLSEDRAKIVYNFLISEGIDPTRISYEGMAYQYPLGGKDYEDRRVEVKIVSD